MNDDTVVSSHQPLYTHDSFESAITVARLTHRRQSWILAGCSVLFGAVLIYIISATQSAMGRNAHLTLTVVLFLAYLALMGGMLVATRVRTFRLRPRCPSCDTPLDLLAEHVARESGMCNACGERIIR